MYPSGALRFANHSGRYAAIGLGFTIPLSVALDNTLLGLLVVGWIVGGCYAVKWATIKNNIVCLGTLALFAVLLLGAFLGVQSATDAQQHLIKYLDLAIVPVFAYYFRDPVTRQRGLLAFAAAMTLVLACSFLVKFGVLEFGGPIKGTPLSPVVFKFRVTHNFLMAFSAFLFIRLAMASTLKAERVIFGVLGLLAVGNVTLMVEGATGYIILLALSLVLVFSVLPKRLAMVAIIAIPMIACVLAAVPGPFAKRVSTITKEIEAWRPGTSAQYSSAGLRLEFYKNTLEIVAEHPVVGVGTGGFPKAYAEKVRGTGMAETQNPHNEYLMIAAQTGLIGLLALLGLFAMQWIAAKRLPTRLETGLAHGLVVTMVIGCLLNSLLLDHTEGLFYAWLTGLLYGGLEYGPRDKPPAPT
ncbi:MAG: O-antigen ligase family protein [Burkholderiales bacterium]